MPKQYPQELKDRAVRLVLGHRDDYGSKTETIRVISERLNISHESLRLKSALSLFARELDPGHAIADPLDPDSF
ncbi:hypothetical protein [Arthrobacter pigmenti]